jgi:hypothetical protein
MFKRDSSGKGVLTGKDVGAVLNRFEVKPRLPDVKYEKNLKPYLNYLIIV